MFEYLYVLGRAKLQKTLGNERGQGLTEYGVILGIVVVIAAGLMASSGDGTFSDKVNDLYKSIADKVGDISGGLKN